MRLFDDYARRLSGAGFHSTIVTSFGIEFAAFEQVLMPQFSGAGAGNIVLLADPGMVPLALADGLTAPKGAGTEYVVHMPRGQSGVFHPKIVFQVGRDGARVVIGSANATSAGLAGNREVVTELTCTTSPTPERAFVVAVWDYLAALVGAEPSPARDALIWLESRTPWLSQAQDDLSVRAWTLTDFTRVGFFANSGANNPSILNRFVGEIAGVPVDRLLVMSPYWDDGLVALRALMGELKPAETSVLIQAAERRFPVAAVGDLDVGLFEIKGAGSPAGRRFSHAKLIIATAGGYDHVLSGSANCTVAALGTAGRAGVNAEASIYRRLPSGSVIERLMLSESLAAPALDVSTIKAPIDEPQLPLDEAAASDPGMFEIEFARISWRPPPSIDTTSAVVELLAEPHGGALTQLHPGHWRGEGALSASIEPAAEEARFARVVIGEWVSGVAIVCRRQALIQRRKERVPRSVEQAMARVQGAAGLDLQLLELLTILEKSDDAGAAAVVKARRMSPGDDSHTSDQTKILKYDEFLKTRHPSAADRGGRSERNTLGGRHADLMRGFLNDLVTGGSRLQEEVLIEEELPSASGESDAGGLGLRRGSALPAGSLDQTVPAEPIAPCDRLEPADLEKAVGKYQQTIAAQAKAGLISGNHMLRLRLWVMLLLSRRAQLACDTSERGWPRLMLRVLAAFFHGADAPATRLAVDSRYDELPTDFVETWAAVTAAVQALQDCRAVLNLTASGLLLIPHIDRLTTVVCARMGLTAEDLAGAPFKNGVEALTAYLKRIAEAGDGALEALSQHPPAKPGGGGTPRAVGLPCQGVIA